MQLAMLLRDAGGIVRLTAAALAALAVGLPLFYSRFGLMPLDQSIVFDGGWRRLSGQRPFVDFYTPVGLVPSAMQAMTFGAFGVLWQEVQTRLGTGRWLPASDGGRLDRNRRLSMSPWSAVQNWK